MSASMKVVLGGAVLAALGVSAARAAPLTVVDFSTQIFSPGNAVDGNTGTSWLADNHAAGTPDPAAFIVVDLTGTAGDNTALSVLNLLVNGSSNGFNDISRVHVSYSADPVVYGSATFVPLGDFDLLQNATTTIPFNTSAQYIRLDTLRINYGGSAQDAPFAADDPRFYGLAEIGITEGTGVPEPATVGVLGLGVLGLVGRRRQGAWGRRRPTW
jgi:hypothetical protein